MGKSIRLGERSPQNDWHGSNSAREHRAYRPLTAVRILTALRQAKLSPVQLGQAAGFGGRERVDELTRGGRRPTAEEILAIARVTKRAPQWLVGMG